MDIKQSVTTCLRKYADFSGRASRSEYWWFVLAWVIASFAVDYILGQWVGLLLNLGLLVPSLAAASRRLHDMGKSGWFQLIALIPVLGAILLIYWLAQPSVGPNEYGEGPEMGELPTAMPPGAV